MNLLSRNELKSIKGGYADGTCRSWCEMDSGGGTTQRWYSFSTMDKESAQEQSLENAMGGECTRSGWCCDSCPG